MALTTMSSLSQAVRLRLRKVRYATSHGPRRTKGLVWSLLVRAAALPRSICLSVYSIIQADFCVASSCVAFGAVLGKVSPIQLLIMTFFQVTLFAVNEFILLNLIEVSRAQEGETGRDKGREDCGHVQPQESPSLLHHGLLHPQLRNQDASQGNHCLPNMSAQHLSRTDPLHLHTWLCSPLSQANLYQKLEQASHQAERTTPLVKDYW